MRVRRLGSNKREAPLAPPRRLGLTLGLLVSAQFAVVVDYSIVQIALPTIRLSLGFSLSDLQWIVSAYGLTFAGFLLLSGRLSDIYGRKRFFILGLTVFTISSLFAGLSNSETFLILSRMVQGIGAAMASAAGLALITRIFGPIGKLGQALGIFTAVSSAGFTAGILLGGLLTEVLGWRWIFFVNIPVGLTATILSYRILPQYVYDQSMKGRIDLPGAISVTAGLILLVYGLSEVGNGSTSASTYASFILAALILLIFVVIETRTSSPILPLRFLRRDTIFFANATALLTFAATVPWVFLVTQYLQNFRSYQPIYAAAALIPGSMTYFLLGGFGAPKLVKRIGAKRVLIIAMTILTIGLLLTSRISLASDYWSYIFPTIVISAIGGSLSLTASNIAALSGAERGEEGIASGLINTSRQVGGPIGLAIAISVVGLATNGLGMSAPASEVISAFQDGLVAAAGFAAIAVVAALLIPKSKPRRTQIGQASGTVSDLPE